MSNNNNDTEEVFVYMGEGSAVPDDVVRARIHPSVTAISANAFNNCIKLKEIELCEGLLSIGYQAFHQCSSLKQHICIPSTVTNIGHLAFGDAPLLSIHLPDGLERIGNNPFYGSKITQFRIPASITTSSVNQMICRCPALFSLEIPHRRIMVTQGFFIGCYSLRNLALLLPDSDYGFRIHTTFMDCRDLKQLFGSEAGIFNALKCRFDNLPVHKMLYYQSYNNVTTDQLNTATDIRISRRRSKTDPTGREQDCLGMTPLHILACSTSQNIELYKVLVDKYPENLITEDRWGASPLLYTIWGKAPDEIIQFLVKSYQSNYPNYKMNWNLMVETLGGVGAIDGVQNLVDLQEKYFPEESIDWETVLENVSVNGPQTYNWICQAVGPLLQLSISKRVKAIGLKKWRDDITKAKITKLSSDHQRSIIQKRAFISEVKTKLAQYEDEYHRLKEATSMIELVLWKYKINEMVGRKRKHEESTVREQSRIGCGADIIIEHVLPYLVPLSS